MTWKHGNSRERGESFGELREAIISESSTTDALNGSAEVRMGCAKGSSLGGGWSLPWGENALHGQEREDIELDLPGTRVLSSAMKLPNPW